MILSDIAFLALVFGLPIVISIRLFSNAPAERPFVATYLLAIFGSSMVFWVAALALALTRAGGLGMLDGFIELIASVPLALSVGLIARYRNRRSSAL